MVRTMTETDWTERLPELLDRVRNCNRIEVKPDGMVMTVLYPPTTNRGIALEELVARISNRTIPGDGFADNLEARRRPAASHPTRMARLIDFSVLIELERRV
jgi:hypothetical protein